MGLLSIFFSDLLSSDYMEIHYEKDKPVLSRVRHKEQQYYKLTPENQVTLQNNVVYLLTLVNAFILLLNTFCGDFFLSFD